MKISHVLALLILFAVGIQAQNPAYFKKGMFFYDKNELDSALFYFKKNSELNKNSHDSIKGNGFLFLGKTYKLKQEYNNAFFYYNKAEAAFLKNKNYNQITSLYISFSEFYRAKRDYLAANLYLEKSKKLIDNHTISKKIIASFWNRKAAVLLESKNDYQASIKCSEIVIAIAREINEPELEASSFNEIACIYENFINPKAEYYFKEAIRLNKKANQPLSEAEVMSNLCRWYLNQKRFKEAKLLLDVGFKIVQKNNYEVLYINYYRSYCKYYIHKKNFKKALYYQSLEIKADNLESSRKWSKVLFDAERKYELIKNQTEIKEKSLLLKLQEKQIANYSIRYMVFLVLFFAACVIAVLVYSFLKKVKKQNQKLQLLSDENKFLMAEANHRINNNLQLIIVLINHEIAKSTKKTNVQVKKILAKVDTVATLHKHLYKNKDKKNVDIKNYLSDIETNFQTSFFEQNIQINFNIQSHPIEVDLAMYLGLLLTELIINSQKHAFSNQTKKEINFSLEINKNAIDFRYSDNGSGTDKKVTLQLIDQLCQQIKISYQLDTTNKFLFTFTKEI
jgi:two-component sensor histidine kinase